MSDLPHAEQDAREVVQALAGLAALLRGADVEPDDETQILLTLAENGGLAAGRVLAYLHDLRGAGDGVAASVPSRLGPWREWVPSRGELFGDHGRTSRVDEIPHQPRRGDPGE